MTSFARFIAGACFALSAAVAPAHPNHGGGPPVATEEVLALGQRTVVALVEAKQLAPSWQGKPVKDVSSRQMPEGLVWIVSVENPSEADMAKRTVYMFFDEFGNFLGGNHTGRLK
jgi:Family of unknown function (DUF6488)